MLRYGVIFLTLALLQCCVVARNANSGEYPGQAAVYMNPNRFGEGVIVNRNHIITAAVNVFDATRTNRLSPTAITVRAGAILISATAPPALAVSRVYAHEGFNPFTLEHNIAVLRMTLDFAFEPNNALPFLAAATLRDRIVPEGTNCELVGWNTPPGNTNLQVITMPVMSREICNSQLNNPLIQGQVLEQSICVGVSTLNPNPCNNNPGAGFYCNQQLVGLLSVGRQCNTLNSPGIVTQTRYYAAWLARQYLREDNPGPGPVAPPMN